MKNRKRKMRDRRKKKEKETNGNQKLYRKDSRLLVEDSRFRE